MCPWAKAPKPPPLTADGSHGLTRAFIRSSPTRFGWGLLVVCVLLWVMAVNYQVNVAYLLVFWLLGILLAGVLMCRRQLLGLSLQAATETECFAGEPMTVMLRASGRGRRRRRLWLKLGQNHPEHAHDWHQWLLKADGDTSLEWALPPQPRGFLRVPELPCVSMAPFGVLLAESLWQYNGETVVYPAPIAHELPEQNRSGNEAGHHRRTVTSGNDLAYLQAHQPGMPLRQIAWKHYAKSGQLLDKRFDDTAASARQDWISYRDYPPHTPKEHLAGLLCYRVLQAERQHHAYTLELPQQIIAPDAGQRTRCLTALGLW